jgi:acetyltransferase
MGALMNYSVFRKGHLENVKEVRGGVGVGAGKAAIPAAKARAKDAAQALTGADATERAKTAGTAREKALSLLTRAADSLTEHEGKELLALYDIPVTKEEVATSEDDAVRIADGIEYPVVMKIDSPDILHKTEAGGLKLGIKNADEVRTSYNEILENARSYKADARISGVLIQEMVTEGTEVIVGAKSDPQFGPTLLFGLGGIFVEILKDVSLRVAPITRQDALEMIKEIKGFNILAGARGRAKADIEAIANVLVKVSRMTLDLEDSIAELDINPLIVLPEGKGARAADALVIKR